MKPVFRLFIASIFLLTVHCGVSTPAAAQSSVSFQLFYDDMSPYGEWIDNPDYGYVWVPDVSDDFAPYSSNGYWIYTDAGWTWYSDYAWGWAPFHYGRWYYDPYYGYAWIPGNEWGPGWVTWRMSAGYYGWAPIGPGISIDFAYGGGYQQPYNQWHFVRDRDFGRPKIYNYYVSVNNYTTIINQSTVINNIYESRADNMRYNTGPNRNDVQRRSGNNVRQVNLRQTDRPSQNLASNELRLYRPRVERNQNNGVKPAPTRTTNWNDGKPEVRRVTESRRMNNGQPGNRKPNETPVVNPRTTDQPGQVPVKPFRRDEPITPRTKDQPVQEPVKPFRKDQPVNVPVNNDPKRVPWQTPRKMERVRTVPVTQPVQEQKKREPVRQPQTKQPVQQPQNREPVRQPQTKQPVQQPQTRQPVQQPQEKKPANNKRKEKPVKNGPNASADNIRTDLQWPTEPQLVFLPPKILQTETPFDITFSPRNNNSNISNSKQ
ncbi:MAG: hypothetical protein IPP73_16890 [Chitinophagaceae bacterium]|nr:hypothetical protein [Chitinophagaceae bacterium]